MKKLFTILIACNALIVFSQEKKVLNSEDSVLLENLIKVHFELESKLNTIDSILRASDSIYLAIDKSYPFESIEFNYFELKRSKQRFDSLYANYIENVNFPNSFPINNIDKHRIIGFGNKIHPIYKVSKFHKGIDIPAQKGESVISTISGMVISSIERKSGYGNHIIIKSEDEVKVLYAHLDSINVKQGDKVRKGQPIGTVGNTGMSIGNHLHYEIYIEDKPVNPIFTIFDLLSKKDLEIIHMNYSTSLD